MNGRLGQPRRGRRAATATYLMPTELAERWRMSVRTLERWRAMRTGPAWLRMNGRVLYALEDVLAFEATRRAP